MNGNKEKSGKGSVSAAAVLILTAALAAFQIFAFVFYLNRISDLTYKMNTLLDLQAEAEETPGHFVEDGYLVEGEFEIRNTSAVSDAYLSGDASALDAEEKETLDLASGVLSKIITEDMTRFEKEKAVYDWMYDNIAMDESGTRAVLGRKSVDQAAPLGVLKSGSAVCVGYATTFRLLVNMLGMECHIPHNEYHSWDLVLMEDGCWYHVDIYYDVTSDTRYGNFNMNDQVCLESHDFEPGDLPPASGFMYSPQNQFSREISSIYKLPAAIKKDTAEGMRSLFYSFRKAPAEDELGAVDYIMSPVEYALSEDDRAVSISYTWYEGEEEDDYILGIFVNIFSEEYTYKGNTGQKALEKMKEAYEKAFGVTIEEYESSYSGSEGGRSPDEGDDVSAD